MISWGHMIFTKFWQIGCKIDCNYLWNTLKKSRGQQMHSHQEIGRKPCQNIIPGRLPVGDGFCKWLNDLTWDECSWWLKKTWIKTVILKIQPRKREHFSSRNDVTKISEGAKSSESWRLNLLNFPIVVSSCCCDFP